jgi:hypothetical protein
VPPEVVHGFQNPGPGPAKLLVMVYPAAGLAIVEEMYALLSATRGAPDPAEVRALFTRHDTELMPG